MLAEPTNTRRATPERVLWLFAIFTILAALSAVRDCRYRPLLESAAPAPAATWSGASGESGTGPSPSHGNR